MANWTDFEEANWGDFEEVKTKKPQQQGKILLPPDNSDILKDKTLTSEQKMAIIKKRGEDFRKQVDREAFKKNAKLIGGEILTLGSTLIPVGLAGAGLKALPAVAKVSKPAAKVVGELIKNVPGLATAGAVGGIGTAMTEDKTALNDYLKAAAGTAAANIAGGKAIQGGAKIGKAVLNSNALKTTVPKVQEFLNSVPSAYSKRALEKELAGDSIFKGKFNKKDLNENYRIAGEKAIAGFNDAASKANEGIENALNALPEGSLDSPRLITGIIKDIDKYSHGGRINPALDQKGNDILGYLEELNNKKNKIVDFHNIKSNIQNQLRNQYGKESGEGINALKGMGAKIREALNDVSPEYAAANAERENLFNIKSILGGLDKKTVASRLRNAEGDAAIRNGYNQAANDLNEIVSPQYKFMDDVNDLRAREALEQWFPGQGQGFGSNQGGGNVLRAILGTAGTWQLHNPAILAAFSPKISGKGVIRGLGLLNKGAKGISNVYDKAIEKYLNSGFGITKNALRLPQNPVSAETDSY